MGDNNIVNVLRIIAVAILVPIGIDLLVFGNTIQSNISNEAWASFLGSYIGGLWTMVALFITISHNKKQLDLQKSEQKDSENEKRRLSIRPYLNTTCVVFDENIQVGINDRDFRIEESKVVSVSRGISIARKEGIQAHKTDDRRKTNFTYLYYIIRNIGAGSAVDMIMTIDEYTENLAIAKDETINILFSLDENSIELNIGLQFNDIEQLGFYTKTDHISFMEENGEKYPIIEHVVTQK